DLQGGFEILYEVEPIDEDQQVSKKLLESTVQTLNDRVNRLGISETVIDIEGDDRIRVQLAGVKDQEEARDMLSTSALLTFRDVDYKGKIECFENKESNSKQNFESDSNKTIGTLEIKKANKFREMKTKNAQKNAPDNLLAIWMDYEEGD